MGSSERVLHEERLRHAVLAGDEAAWRTLYDENFARLWTYVSWRCGAVRDLAEEVTQETWLLAVKRIRAFNPHQGKLLSWLSGIAANVLHNKLRGRRRRQERPLLP